MHDPNPYQAPEAPLPSAPLALDGVEMLAGRGERFGAVVIDRVICQFVTILLVALTGNLNLLIEAMRTLGARSMSVVTVGYGVLSILVFVMVQGYPLAKNGQTWGKKLLSIRIVDLQGEPPPFWRLILLRYVPTPAIALLPVVGNLYALVDALFIFRQDKRCLHDLIAGTQVVNVRR
jgi:uncharacterized RDD family membrane protein YckC